MVSQLKIFDSTSTIECSESCLLWDRFAYKLGHTSILTVQEDYFYETRAEFLQFVHAFGECLIDGKPIRDHLRLSDGFSTWWISSLYERHPLVYGDGLFEIFKLRALERYLTRENTNSAKKILLYSENCVLASAMRELCKSKGIAFSHCSETNVGDCRQKAGHHQAKRNIGVRIKGNISRLYLCLPLVSFICSAASIAKRSVDWWRQERSLFPTKPKIKRKKGLLLGTWFPNIDKAKAQKGEFRSRYWEGVHDILETLPQPVHWFFIYSGTPDKIKEAVVLRDSFVGNLPATSHTDMTFCEECVTKLGAVRAYIQWLQIAWRGRRITPQIKHACSWPNSSLNVFTFVESLWLDSSQGFYLLRQLLFLAGIRAYCELIGVQDKVITSSELQFWERMLFYTQRAQGCEHIYAAQHSIVHRSDFRYMFAAQSWDIPEFALCMPDVFHCNGSAAHAAMQKANFPVSKLGMLEAVRFMGLAEVESYKPTPPRRLLVATSYFTKETKAMLYTLAQAMRKSDLPLFENILIKPHPALPVESFLHEFFTEPQKIVEGSIETYLTDGTVVYTDSATSVSLSALYRGVPVIVHSAVNGFELGVTSDIVGIDIIQTPETLLKALQSPQYCEAALNFFCLEKSLPRWHDLLQNFRNT